MALTKEKAAPKVNFEEQEDGLETGADTGADTGTAEQETRALTPDERVAAQVAKNAGKSTAAAASASVGEQTQAAASTSTAVATAAPAAGGSLAARMAAADPFKGLENALRVDYNTLNRIMVTNGNVQDKETKTLCGDHAVLELISIQKHWVMSPGGDKKDEESLEFLKYSDDGVHARDTGETLESYRQAAIKAGFKDARIAERLILVGMLESTANGKGPVGELVQMDLAPRSVANFNRHRATTTFRIGRNLQKPEGAERLLVKADVQSKGDNNWTDAKFEAAPAQ